MKAFERGLLAEQVACELFLKQHPGSRLLGHRVTCRQGELDLVFEVFSVGQESPTLVFVEVRFRQPQAWVSAAASLRPKKKWALQQAARFYLSRYRGSAFQLEFQFWCWDGKCWDIYHG